MAFVVRRPRNRWEIRESHATADGPRSRTLASFTKLTPDVIERARRAGRHLDSDALLRSARRAGAPIERSRADALGSELSHALARGQTLRPGLALLLKDQLEAGEGRHVDTDLAEWIGATPEHRARALVDLFGLADQLPKPRRSSLRFPRLHSARR